ncbi:MAG: hypothetical protein KGJ59_12235 [Bacteroidota bacterium]|nr:hypothetical protein [Bacteroidota bacterium]
MKNLYSGQEFYIIGFLMLIFSLPLYSQIGTIIPSDRRVDWRNPCYEGDVPRYIQNYVNVKTQYIDLGQTATQAMNNAISDAHH